MRLSERIDSLFPTDAAIPPEHRLPGRLDQRGYLVDGEIRTWDGPLAEVRSPICEGNGPAASMRAIGGYPLLTEVEATAALAAAREAYDHGRGEWPTMGVAARIRHVEEFVRRLKLQRDAVVRLVMWEIGKTYADACKEFDRTVAYAVDTIEALKDLDRAGSRFEIREGILGQIRRAPLGVVLCMGPYNYPLNETFTIFLPALIMGNTVVFKPPRMGVLLYGPLLEALRDCFPRGVVNTVYGDGARVVGPLMASGQIDCLGFIGSCKVADILKHQHPYPHRLRSVLGLGAKNVGIVLPDADLETAVAECVLGGLSYNGQRCTALKLLYVHRAIAPEFTARLAAAVDALAPGLPWDEGAQITPLPEPGKPAYLAGIVADAVAAGAQVLNPHGGRTNGTYYHPAVVYPVTPGSALHEQEQFGPVVPVAVFDDIAQPVGWIEESRFGQQVSIFGSDPGTIAELVDPLVNQVCRVNLNSQCQRGPDTFPFTGRKDSAEGTLSVSDALRVFSIRTLVAAKANAGNEEILTAIIRGRKSTFLNTDFIF
ncbi:MAG: NADP-dependent glyceraldehyde-3-phosphate dehydrogenase [Candidatus Krumholzibacteriia bacterium]